MANPVDPSRPTNRLADEPSLYLRQHAHDPVDWRPWGAEAIEEARERDVPVFISIGYSTCYWCHVMARESFSDATIARELNERFVCIKVDREDRPDLDDLYMTATVIYNRGSGGWPMTVFAEPSGLKPFFAGTYFPAHESMHGRPSLMDLMHGVSDAWANRREAVLEAAESLAGAVEEQMAVTREPVLLGPRDVERAVSSLLTTHDRVHGGFGGAPKFPQAPQLELLLEILPGAGDENTSTLIDTTLRRTLDAMMTGGIHDHLAGGFHRYAVDAAWAVPHFEKMLYDNAQLASVYRRAGKLLDDDMYTHVADKTSNHLDTDMRLDDGVYSAAIDAEVDGREGASYAWTDEQIREAIAGVPRECRKDLEILGIDRGPGFRDPHHPDDEPKHVLSLLDRPDRWAAANGWRNGWLPLDKTFYHLLKQRERLLPAAVRDDKAITAWNGLALAAQMSDDPEHSNEWVYKTADFLLEHLRDSDGVLHRSWREGVLGPVGVLEDYSALACGLLAIVEAGGDPDGKYLNAVHEIMNVAETRFSDPSTGAYFDTAEGDEYLFARSASIRDNATPGGAGMMISALRRLGRVTGESAYTERAARALRAFSADIVASPSSAPTAIINLYQLMREAPELMGHVFAGLRPPLPSEPEALLEVESTTNEIVLREGEPEAVMLRVVIPEGFHVTAPVFNAEGALEPSETMPMRVTVIEGSGVRAYAEYPAGEAFGDAGERIYRGIIELPVAMEREGEWSGSPALAIAYQACRDDACLAPATLRVGIRLVRG